MEDLRTLLLPDGGLAGEPPDLTTAERIDLLRAMLRIRVFDTRMLNMQRQGRIGFYGTATGEEASVIDTAASLRATDWLFPALRQGGALLHRGFPLDRFVTQCIGNSLDNLKGRQMPVHASDESRRVVSWSSVIGTQLSHGVGAAMAARIRGDDTVIAACLGDGATSSAEFHVSLNFAAVYEAPVVFFCQNNQWAISVPFARQSLTSVAQKAVAYGMPGVRVDGNDVLAVLREGRAAVERARAGGGPTLIECLTYRRGGHSSSDDPTRYRNEAEVLPWVQKDPIDRYGRWLEAEGVLSEAGRKAMVEELAEEISVAIRAAEAADPLEVETLFEDVYETLPASLAEQVAAVKGRRAGDRADLGAFPL